MKHDKPGKHLPLRTDIKAGQTAPTTYTDPATGRTVTRPRPATAQ